MRKLKTRSAIIFSLALVLLFVACQTPPAPVPVAPVETVVVDESRGVVRDLNVPGTLSAATLVVRSAVSMPQGSLPWSVFQGAVPELTTTGAFSVTGLLEADGGITVDDTAFTVADATGAVTMAGGYGATGCSVSAAGVLTCNGAGTFDGAVTANGGLIVDTPAFTVANATGVTGMAGGYNNTGCTVGAAGNLSCDGAVILDSTLAVTGTADLRGNISDTGGVLTVADNVLVDGQADAVQLAAQGHSSQSNSIFVVEQSDGTDVFQVSSAGHIENDFALFWIDDGMIVDGAADTVQLTVQGYTTQTNVLQTWEIANGTDVATLSAAGALDVASTINYGTQNLYPVGYGSTGYEITCGVSATFTGTLAVTATPLTTATYIQVTQQTDSNANAATMTASTPSGNVFTIKSWKADGATPGSVGTKAYWCAFGPQ